MQSCIICATPLNGDPVNSGAISYSCKVCGDFEITRIARDDYQSSKFSREAVKISVFLRNKYLFGTKVILFYDKEDASKEKFGVSFEEAIMDFPRTIGEKLDRALLNLAQLSRFMGDYISIDQFDYPIFYSETNDSDSFFFMMQQLFNNKLIENDNGTNSPGYPTKIRLTANGWNRIIELEQGKNVPKTTAFIAMWFNESVHKAYHEAISPAISECGYEPVRVDFDEHNEKICDRIIADIRKSKFVICDFTGQRGGVYFEAGFAMGLGIPVIWTCREDDIGNLHFDTRQYNHIVWKDEEDLYKKLKKRIEATIV